MLKPLRNIVDDIGECLIFLRLVLRTFGDERVMIGTDYPFTIADMSPHATIDALGLDTARALALREGNARRFLGLAA